MRRSSVHLIVLVLGLVTSIALLRLGDLLTVGPITGGVARGDGGSALVHGFYDAVNTTLETGHSTDLDRLLAADFVHHGGPPGQPTTRDGFVRHLVMLHGVLPTMRLAVHETIVRGDVAVVHVRVDAAARGAFLRIPLLDQSVPWGTVDVFRIASGRIAEHWGGGHEAPFLEPLQQMSLDVPSSALQTVSLTRTTVAPGGSVDFWTIAGPEAIYLETGRIAVGVMQGGLAWRSPSGAPGEPESVGPGIETTLTPGGLFLLAEGSRATIRNDGGMPTTFLVIALRKPGGSKGSSPIPAAGTSGSAVTSTNLVDSLLTTLPRGPAVLGLGRATIAPGARFPVESPGMALFAVEAGNLRLASTDGTVMSQRAADGLSTTATDGILGAGNVTVLAPGAHGELVNVADAPLVLLVVTIVP